MESSHSEADRTDILGQIGHYIPDASCALKEQSANSKHVHFLLQSSSPPFFEQAQKTQYRLWETNIDTQT